MYDRPNAAELLDAVRLHLESAIVPAVRADRKLYFQTLVAINVLKIVGRELHLSDAHLRAAWERLNALDDDEMPLPRTPAEQRAAFAERDAALCASIRAGDFDANARRPDVFAHVKATSIAQLQVANPRFLAKLAAEDADPALDAWHGRNEG